MINFFLHLRWQDFIDILILTVILYRLILMVQGTRTSQILAGFLVLAAGYYISNTLRFEGVSWVLTNLFNSLVVVIVVLFQTDFRNALAQMGRNTIFRDNLRLGSVNVVDMVMETCEQFSKSRIGALIVFEKSVGLRNYMNSGTIIDAQVSPQLLYSIFNPTSPLHDGAVIIDRHGVLAASSCILPLTTRLDLTPKYGTRHRAALGLSEETDSAVIVVSEENGKISMIIQGEFFQSTPEHSIIDGLKEYLPNVT